MISFSIAHCNGAQSEQPFPLVQPRPPQRREGTEIKSGTIKSMRSQGFGFLSVTGAAGEVWFHHDQMYLDPEYQGVSPFHDLVGAVIEFQVRDRDGRPAAHHITGPGGIYVKPPASPPPPQLFSGTIKVMKKDFGFLTVNGFQKDIWFHHSQLQLAPEYQTRTPFYDLVGSAIECQVHAVPQGFKASLITGPGGLPLRRTI
jgi:cold shock CspA family protein